jgi:hypothetical protein
VAGDTYINGSLGIGIAPSASYDIYGSGKTQFACTDLSLIINDYYIEFFDEDGEESILFKAIDDEPVLIPTGDGCGLIGTAEDMFYDGYFCNLTVDDQLTTSDIRYKENIRELNGTLEKIKNVQGLKFDFKSTINPKWSESKKNKIEERRKDRFGFSAQDLKEVFPELVKYDKEHDKYGVRYSEMIPILVEAIKEQQSIIEEMQSEISDMQGGKLKSLALSGEIESLVNDQCLLHQNTPNPFGENTRIRYNLPEGTTNADIIIYDMTGKQLRRIPLNEDGQSSIQVHGGELDAGMYMYSMIVENQLIDTKQMVITE